MFFPSDANFILVRCTQATRLYEYLVSKEIIVRNRSSEPLLQNCLRITVGTRQENEQLIRAMKGVLRMKVIFVDRDGTIIAEPPMSKWILRKARIDSRCNSRSASSAEPWICSGDGVKSRQSWNIGVSEYTIRNSGRTS